MDTTMKQRPKGSAKSTWRGALTFGMVTFPVQLFKANEPKDLQFTRLHAGCEAGDTSRVGASTYCKGCDKQNLEADEMQRVYEWSKGQYVPIGDEDLEALQVQSLKEIALTKFAPAGSVDAMFVQQTYWLEPEDVGAKPYALLTQAIADKNVVGIGSITLNKKQRPVALRVLDGTLVMETLYYPEELKTIGSGTGAVPAVDAVTTPELEMAHMLVDAFAGEWDPTEYSDGYRAAAYAMIERKKAGQPEPVASAEKMAEPTTDMMSALRATLEAQRAARAAKEAA
jgi:DNA end-binding protein Ku